MHPNLFSIGPFTVRTYGLAMAASFLLAFYLAARRSPRIRIDPELVLDSFLPIFLGSILGARMLYIITDFRTFIESPIEMFKMWKGGLVWYGGFLGGMIGAYVFMRARKFSFWKMMDFMAPYAGLGYAIHRTFGCFLGYGCCFGRPSDLPFPFGYEFPAGSPASQYWTPAPYSAIRVFPSQLYEAATGLTIMAVLMILRRRPYRIGQQSAIFLWIYSTFRFGFEFLRGDADRGFIGPLSTSQLISIPLFLLGIILWFRKTETVTTISKEEAGTFLNELLIEKDIEEKKKLETGK